MCPIVRDDGFKLVDGGHPKHLRPKRGGVRKCLAVPAQMFAHAMKLALATECLKLSSMIQQDGKALVERDHLAGTYFATGSASPACKRAGLHGVTPHTLRHTAATWIMQRGVPTWEAAAFLSMSEATLTQVYGHHHPDYMRAAADAIGNRRRGIGA